MSMLISSFDELGVFALGQRCASIITLGSRRALCRLIKLGLIFVTDTSMEASTRVWVCPRLCSAAEHCCVYSSSIRVNLVFVFHASVPLAASDIGCCRPESLTFSEVLALMLGSVTLQWRAICFWGA